MRRPRVPRVEDHPMPFASIASFFTLLRRFRRNRTGSAAVEFVLVAPVFFALLFAIIEVSIMFFASQVLETVAQQGAREILTGQAQTQGLSSTQFKTFVCNQIPAILSCNNLYIDVESYTSFETISLASPIDANGNFITTMNYNTGGSSTCTGSGCTNSIVVLRAYYPWQLFVTGLGFNIANLTGNQRLLVATAVFRNEPY
jgi:Flp pilus assembly protein TadG